jgi:hypothetical protein
MTYYHFEGSLVQPTMEMPSGVDFSFQTNGVENYFTAKSKWETHLRSLPKIKVEGKLKEGWVEEGKDFVLEPKFVEYYPDRNPLGDTGANDLSHGSGYERIAVPVSETEANAETVEKKEDSRTQLVIGKLEFNCFDEDSEMSIRVGKSGYQSLYIDEVEELANFLNSHLGFEKQSNQSPAVSAPVEEDEMWNNVIAAIAACELFQKVRPHDVDRINDWKTRKIKELKQKYSITLK